MLPLLTMTHRASHVGVDLTNYQTRPACRQVINAQLKATFSTDWGEQFSSCEDETLGSVFTACFGEGGEEEIRYPLRSHHVPVGGMAD